MLFSPLFWLSKKNIAFYQFAMSQQNSIPGAYNSTCSTRRNLFLLVPSHKILQNPLFEARLFGPTGRWMDWCEELQKRGTSVGTNLGSNPLPCRERLNRTFHRFSLTIMMIRWNILYLIIIWHMFWLKLMWPLLKKRVPCAGVFHRHTTRVFSGRVEFTLFHVENEAQWGTNQIPLLST